ncbi:hypothetical protein [Paenibacillus lautus]|uniref:hypothetical protein n=1 Tax=Paenibacillus lautus TaxID=1401 RepID=UPI003D26E163
MIGLIAVAFGEMEAFIVFNLLFDCLYLLSRTAGHGFYRWMSHDLDFLIVLSYPFFRLT